MTSKERVKLAIGHQEADRVPFGLFGTGGDNQERIMKFLGVSTQEEMYHKLGIDIWYAGGVRHIGEQRYYKGEMADLWGIPASAREDGDSSRVCPLSEVSSVDEVEAYEWPKPIFDGGTFDADLDMHAEFAIIGGVWAPIFHNVTWLCGFETTLMNLVAQPEVSEALIRHVTDYWVAYARKILEIGCGRVDIIENCNDFGTQNGLIMSPECFRLFFKPALKRLYDTIKEFDVKVMQHSCGAIVPILPDLIELGVDIVNPVQVSATGMDIELLKNTYGGKVTFFGGIDTQHVLPEGPIEIIRQTTRHTIDVMGKGGGYILAPSQGVESDVPVEHLLAMFEEGRK